MGKAGGSLGRGRRLRHEVPSVPDSASLNEVEQRAQSALRRLVEEAGGRFDSQTAIPSRHHEVLASLFQHWAVSHGERTSEGVYFNGQPGLWHALDNLYPLQDPNRWNRLRADVIERLERQGWRRRSAPRGSSFDISL